MNTRAFTLALIIAGIAMLMVHFYVEDQKSIMVQNYGTKSPVVIAGRDINELELIDDSKLAIINIPKNFQMPDHFKNIKDLNNTVATVPIKKGEQITKPRVTYPGVETGLSRQVSVGKRAVAINITERQAVGKLIKPGDRVDIIVAIDYSSGRKDRQKATTVLQDVLVLSTGMQMTNALPIYGVQTPKIIKEMKLNVYTQYNTVTLELTPIEAQKIVYLLTYANGTPYLSLRNNNDNERQKIEPTKIFDVLGEDAEEAKVFFVEKYSDRKK